MDRRRYVPASEGLEGRALLSFFSIGSSSKTTAQDYTNVPITFLQKEVRVSHLPFYLRETQPNRFLPTSTIDNLTSDLDAVIGQLHSPTSETVNAFNNSLKGSFPDLTLSAAQANRLNRDFGAVLVSAGATPTQTIRLQSDLNQLAYVDTKSIDPSQLAANDYAITLQTAVAVGRPIKQANAPVLARSDGTLIDGGKYARTQKHEPSFVGVYNIGRQGNSISFIQLVTANGNVIGFGPVAKNTGDWRIQTNQVLPDGTYQIYSRVIDNNGHLSPLSTHYTDVKVFTPVRRVAAETLTPPAGPLGLKP